jgi:formate-dependent nitrite reductase membrane component NrfD
MKERAMVPRARPAAHDSYYGRPILKQPTWKHWIPAYFFSGGLAGGSSMLAAGARRSGDHALARRADVTSLAAISASAGFLVADLGVPSRFANMLRVARPTSPMSMGSWLLAAFGPASGAAAACDVLGVFPRLGRLAETSAAVMGPAVASYTAVLVSDTAIPVWHEARRELPFVFVSSAMASAGAAALVHTPPSHAGAARRMALLGVAGEIAATRVMEHRLGALAEPYHHDPRTARLSKAARGLIAAGAAAIVARGRRSRAAAVVGGALVLAGSALERFAIVSAGDASAADPKYVVDPQRHRTNSA